MNKFDEIKEGIRKDPRKWLVTGAAGFIGSNLIEELLRLDQRVVGLDNFSTGLKENLEKVKTSMPEEKWKNFVFIEGDILNREICETSMEGIDHVLHQAALGSVPRSIKSPLVSTDSNVVGFLNVLNAAKNHNISSFTYASSSSVYGDNTNLPKVEENIGNPLSTYALTKQINENYAQVFALNYGFESIGLRYFNVFGRRQNPHGEYSAVIPRWIFAMISERQIQIYGDGETSRDFCYIENIIQMNILSALSHKKARNQVYNVANGDSTSLNELFNMIKDCLKIEGRNYTLEPEYRPFRKGDVMNSQADISKAKNFLGYEPKYNINKGLAKTIKFYLEN